ncbi:MAG: MBL fold metallo-hydrolase, partial [Lachnospiraceae bacterium]|nr:MBL fold metallo-hydrolase [Lachnospiraceae bacterium]
PPAPPENAPIKNTDNVAQDYVLNHNTKKFHYPYCASAKSIKAKNREDVHSTREEIISRGYVPCKNCNP